MSEFKSNAEANVSAAKGVVGGYVWRAPVGTPLPDNWEWTPPLDDVETYTLTEDTEVDNSKTYYTRSGSEGSYTYTAVASPTKSGLATYYEKTVTPSPWACMGYVSEDGETFQTNSESTVFRDQNGHVIHTSQTTYDETFACSFVETKKSTFQSIYGKDAVTDIDGTLKVTHTGEEPGTFSYVFLFLLKDGRKWIRFAEKCKRTSIGDLTTNSSTLLAWNATYQVVRSEETDGYFVDYFESTETEA